MNDIIVKAASVTPSARQLAWQEMEFYAFVHFTVNTFTDKEWGDGTESPEIFNPTEFNAAQWVSVIKDGGMSGLILTAKHHDGFCLWPSKLTDHSVKSSPWREGKGDVVADVARACQEAGVWLGIYLSPWDRHEPSYGDSPRYNKYFRNQLRELLTGYGEIFCVWFDGACGEGPNGKRQQYDWDGYYRVVRELQPKATIHVCGPDVRWCGNEAGHCRSSEWSVVPAVLRDRERIAEKSQQNDDSEYAKKFDSRDDDLGSRQVIAGCDSLVWYPAEVNTSIRPGWFYHRDQDDKVKSLSTLLDIYFQSVGGNACFLLNLPPDQRGLIHENDAARVREIGNILRKTFATDFAADAQVTASHTRIGFHPSCIIDGRKDTYWTTEDGQEQATPELRLPRALMFNVAILQEQIAVGQRIERFRIKALLKGNWHIVAEATVVGHKRLLRFPPVRTDRVRIEILESRVAPTLSRVGLFFNPQGTAEQVH